MSPDPQLLAPPPRLGAGPGSGSRHRLLTVVVALLAVAAFAGAALAWSEHRADRTDAPGPVAAGRDPDGTRSPTVDPVEVRDREIAALLDDRGRAVTTGDRAAFLAQVDTGERAFAAAQSRLIDRLAAVPFTAWDYQVIGSGPALPPARAGELPAGSVIVRARLTYRLDGTTTDTDREQYLTVVPRGGRWLIAADSDSTDPLTQRDLWDLGPVRVVRGESSVVVADRRRATPGEMRRLAGEADLAVEDVGRLWEGPWSGRPVVLLPGSQKDMATIIEHQGEGLAQIAAVTTGSFEAEGSSRGDRVVINPAAFDILGSLGRRVVLSHEMTHVATRASSVRTPPIWLSEGFADYVAYDAAPVPTSVVAADVLEDVRDGDAPRQLPEALDFDAGAGDIAGAYEAAWLACRMIAERYGERRLVRFYVAMSDGTGPGWPRETPTELGVTARELTRQWRAYLAEAAGS